MNSKSKSYNSIDLMKFILAIVVVSVHTEPLIYSTNLTAIYSTEALRRIAVPFFFVATGFLITIRENSGKIHEIKDRLIKTLKLYLILSLVYLPLAVIYYLKNDTGFLFDCVHYIRGLVLTGEHYNSWMLWYLLSAVYCLLTILIFDKLKLSRKIILPVMITIAAALSFGIDVLIKTDADLLSSLGLVRKIIDSTIVDDRLVRGFIYIPAGMLLGKVKNTKLMSLICLPIAVVGFFLVKDGPIFYRSLWIIIGSIGLFGITPGITLKDSKIYPALRFISSFLYFSHLWIWSIFYTIVYHEKTYGWPAFLVTTLVGIIIGACYYGKRKNN